MKTFDIILATDEHHGIGKAGKLPRNLPSDLKYFQKTTTTTSDPQKQNAVIMGRNTRLSIPEHRRPLPKRVNCVLSHLKEEGGEKSETTLFCSSFDECLHILSVNEMIENIFVIGGAQLYNTILQDERLHHIYLTKIKGDFQCDTFFAGIPTSFSVLSHTDWQEENGISYSFWVYGIQK